MKSKLTNDIKKVTFDAEFHRGGRDSRSENTLYSYLFAIEKGATTIECDMQFSDYGEIYLAHDPFLLSYYAKDEHGNYVDDNLLLDIRTMPLMEVKKYNVASINPSSLYYFAHGKYQLVSEIATIPTIDELFTLVKKYAPYIKINMESKLYHDASFQIRAKHFTNMKAFIDIFNKKVIAYGLEDNVSLQSFDWASLVYMRKINPRIRTIALVCNEPFLGRTEEYIRPYENKPSPYLSGINIDDFKGNVIKAIKYLGIDDVSPYYKEVSLNFVEEAHRYHMRVIPWTVNNLKDMEIMYDMGVDGIISDKGILLKSFLLKKGECLLRNRKIKSKYHLD